MPEVKISQRELEAPVLSPATRYLDLQRGLLAARLIEPLTDAEEAVFIRRMDLLWSRMVPSDRQAVERYTDHICEEVLASSGLPLELRKIVLEGTTLDIQLGELLEELGLFERRDQMGIMRAVGYVRTDAGNKVAKFLEDLERFFDPKNRQPQPEDPAEDHE